MRFEPHSHTENSNILLARPARQIYVKPPKTPPSPSFPSTGVLSPAPPPPPPPRGSRIEFRLRGTNFDSTMAKTKKAKGKGGKADKPKVVAEPVENEEAEGDDDEAPPPRAPEEPPPPEDDDQPMTISKNDLQALIAQSAQAAVTAALAAQTKEALVAAVKVAADDDDPEVALHGDWLEGLEVGEDAGGGLYRFAPGVPEADWPEEDGMYCI